MSKQAKTVPNAVATISLPDDSTKQEFITILKELKSKITPIKEQIQPLLSKIKTNQLPTTNGISYLEAKFHIMLNYIINILFFMLIKTSGKSINKEKSNTLSNHIKQLVEMRLLLEKIKPIDDRMKYQIDKLVKIANQISDSKIPSTNDELRANPDRLLSSSKEDEEDVSENISENSQSEDESSDESDNEKEEELYKVPKMIAVHYDEDDKKKAEKQKMKAMKQIEKSNFLKEAKVIFGEEPEELYSIGTESRSRYLQELEKAEMENFNRRTITKKEKKIINQELKIKDPLEEVSSFTEYKALDRYAKAKKASEKNEKLAVVQYLGKAKEALDEVNKQSKSREENTKKHRGFEIDVDINGEGDEENLGIGRDSDKKRKRRGGAKLKKKVKK
ncbi:hypothetical protein ABK040_012362 [Willaertia magna]